MAATPMAGELHRHAGDVGGGAAERDFPLVHPTDSRARTELRRLLLRDAILWRSATQPVLSRDGTPARWMLDSLSVTLTGRGSTVAARCVLDLLRHFEGRQLATYGLTGVPLLQACVLNGEGRYHGIIVRKEAKPYGSLKVLEGPLDRSEPVVMVDDSVSSGLSMWQCADRLEGAGFAVEGAVCLVRFGYGRGTSKLVERGYRMGAVFDIYEDFIPHIDGESPYETNPTKDFGTVAYCRPAPEGADPTALAREVIGEYLRSGRVLTAPKTLDRRYDCGGGCWVSLRRRRNIHDRPARSGFWHFPGELPGTAGDDVVSASLRTARELARRHRDALAVLDDCAVAVTFFSPLEQCTLGDLDNDRYGIVVRSAERPAWMGGALPRMPGIATEWQQFAHAWRRNARLSPREPYRLYRHRVDKVVEPGVVWQPSGVPLPAHTGRYDTGSVAEIVARRARQRVLGELTHTTGVQRADTPTSREVADLCPPVDGVFVTIFANGRLAGCAGGFDQQPDRAVDDYVSAAVDDIRFQRPSASDDIAVSVSLLFNRHDIGAADPDWIVGVVRFPDQCLLVRQRDRTGLLLPFMAVRHNLTPRAYVDEVIDKAGVTRPPYHWTRYDYVSALATADRVCLLEGGLPRGVAAATSDAEAERLRRLLVRYIRRHHSVDGPPLGRYDVFADRLHAGLSPARLAYGAWVKARAGLRCEAEDDLHRLEVGRSGDGWIRLRNEPATISEAAFVLLANCELGASPAWSAEMSAMLCAQIDLHGRFATHDQPDPGADGYQDYAPGQALLALARSAQLGAADVQAEAIRRALRHYRIRFRHNHHWGAVAWLSQAFLGWGRVFDGQALIGFAYEIVDWALRFQSHKSGAFLNDHQPDSPGATTAVYLEAVGAVRAAAETAGDGDRERRYRGAGDRAVAFLDRLVYQDRDIPVLPNPAWAIGGVRSSVNSSDVRIDYVHHALSALLTLWPPGEG
jgi:orotate phosphoribosyltransferase/AMMECR1 domain-containing protein